VRLLLAGIVATVLLALGGEAVRRATSRDGEDVGLAAVRGLTVARLIRDHDIQFFQRRIARDPTGTLDLIRLGTLYLDRYAETGDERDLAATEAAARRSLSNREAGNSAARHLLTVSLIGQHRFAEAREEAERLVAAEPEEAVFRAILGEVLLELGAYARADSLFRPLLPRRYEAALAPRYARWLELSGRSGEARRLLEAARDQARAQGDLVPLRQLAWYELRLGELALRHGNHREARRRLEGGLALIPDDWRLLAARARLALVTGDSRLAMALGDSSLARHVDPATLAVVGDAWLAQGDSGSAQGYFRALEAAAAGPRGGFHRAWYLALLDHGRKIPEVLAAVSDDLLTRKDIYGYDLVAWASFKSGRIAEARLAMDRALVRGSDDPQLLGHAAAIDSALRAGR
jgi:tetratricopeptide (TPR) repeat protein